ncbi:MAG: helix-turn-helix domain-containing protein [Candidatus Paceibacterota bacterium]
MFEKYLQEIGLNDKEAAVYLSLLQVENASVIELSSKTKINRSTVYIVLESLSKKGLVTETSEGKKTHYQAESPERLETYVERQKVILEEQSKRLKDVIPQLKSIQRETGEKPVIKYYDGREGIISLNEDFFSAQKNPNSVVNFIFPGDLMEEIFTLKERQRYHKVGEKSADSRSIYTYTKEMYSPEDNGERIQIDGKKYPITCDISICDDSVKISILGKKLSGILIKSKDFAETLNSIFNLSFDQLNKKMP